VLSVPDVLGAGSCVGGAAGFDFVELFAGVGGFRLGLEVGLGHIVVSEIEAPNLFENLG
jgi:hypothetical protein